MKRVILLALCFISFTAWSQNDQVMKLRKSKGPIFHKNIQTPLASRGTNETGPLEKNKRLKPLVYRQSPIQTASEPKYFGPKGKFYQNRPNRD